MEKQKTVVKVAGKEYSIVSQDSPEYMQRVAAFVDRRITEMATVSRMPEPMVAVLVSLNMADELIKSQDDNARLRRENQTLRQQLGIS